MAACRGCDTEGKGNFCAQSGLPIGDTSFDSLGAEPDSPALMGAASPDQDRRSEHIRAGSRRRTLALGVLLLGFLAAGSYAALRSPSPEPVPEVAVDEVGDEEGEPGGTDNVSTTDPADPDEPPNADEPAAADDSSWLEGDSQWYVIVAAQGNLHRLDTRTGLAQDLEVPGYPLGRLGDKILLVTEGRVVVTDESVLASDPPLDLPEPLDVNIAVGGPFWLTEGLRDDVFWLQRYDSALEIDLASGILRREIRTRDPYLGPFPAFSPDFRTPLSGGVYRLEPDEEEVAYQRVLDGRVIAQSNDAILVSSCGLELVCENRWVDSATLEIRTDLVVPAYDERAWFVGGSLADGRYVGTTYGRLMDVTSGTELALNESKTNSMFSGELQVSPDGQVLAYLLRARLNVQGIQSATLQTAKLQGLRSSTRPLFIAIPEPG